jgi:transposase
MPYRPYHRDQDWLLPPCLGDLLPVDHPVRFVAEFVDALDLAQLGIVAQPAVEGAPSFPPRLLLGIWLYGFMVRLRTTRKLEQGCCENIAFMWLAGTQRPDHVTLWRFYDANRQTLRSLFKQTVHLAIEVGLVDFALQAVDGTRMAAVATDSLRGQAGLEKLLAAVEVEIAALEQAQERGEGTGRRDHRLLGKRELRERVVAALAKLAEKAKPVPPPPPAEGQAAKGAEIAVGPQPSGESLAQAAEAAAPVQPVPQAAASGQAGRRGKRGTKRAKRPSAPKVSLSDPEAVLEKSRHGYVVGYNGQVVVDSRAQIIVGADVVACSADQGQLRPMFAEAQAMSGQLPAAAAADTGYFDMADIQELARLGVEPYVPDERERRADAPSKNPYHKQHFVYDPSTDRMRCPEGQELTYAGTIKRRGETRRMFQGHHCQGCPALQSGACTKGKARRVAINGLEEALARHAAKMSTDEAQAIVHLRSEIVEPVFGILREPMGLRRFVVRGLQKVKAEWHLSCSAYNLRKLWKLWWVPRVRQRLAVC